MLRNRHHLATLALALFCALSLSADEGMWMPEQMPELAAELKSAGFEMSASSLADLDGYPLGAIVQLPGCTGAFVSSDGLILTNHHCAAATLQYNSTGDRDLVRNGFLARQRSEELWNGPLSRAYVTTALTDVTARMVAGIPEDATKRRRYQMLDQREKTLIAECEKTPGTRCRVAWLFDGLRYVLVRQAEIRDIRLVYAPARGIGEFGGDKDNWMWPRHSGDFAFYRAYVAPDGSSADHAKANVPYHAPQVLKIATGGLADGDPVMVLGYPGKTSRYRTAEELERAIDVDYPRSIHYTGALLAALQEAGEDDAAVRLRNFSTTQNLANTLKYMKGVLESLSVEALLERKREQEQQIRAESGGVLDEISRLDAQAWAHADRDAAFYWMIRSSALLRQAVQIYRYALERPKKDLERRWGYQDRDLPRIREMVERSQKTTDLASERAALRFFVREAADLPAGERIPALDEALRATGRTEVDEQIDAWLDTLFAGTRMTELAVRQEMLRSPAEALRKRQDSFIDLAAALTPMMLELEEREDESFAAMTALRPKYMERLLALRKGKVYPDANGTLRIAWGTVEGYRPSDAVTYASKTSVLGIVAKNERGDPYHAPQPLLEAIREERFGRYVDAELGTVPVNFVASTDSSAGSSGSPLLNRKGEVVGVLFDGNYESMGSDFAWNPAITRSINVDIRYVLWVLDAVEGAENLLREMAIEPQFAAKGGADCHGAGGGERMGRMGHR